MFKRMTFMLVALLLVFGGIFGFKLVQQYFMGQYFATFTPPPVTVAAEAARRQQWQPFITAVGTLKAVNGVDISAETEGLVRSLHFTSGERVEAGRVLLEIDDQVEQASLRSQEARLQLAKLSYERDRKLIGRNLTSQDQLDRSQAEYEEALAAVEQTRATIAKKVIRAPFTGKIGIRQVDLGQYISAGDPIATLQAVDTLYLDFSLPERHYPNLHLGQTARFAVEAYPGKQFEATIAAINAKVDPNTRNIDVRAEAANPDGRLVPGMFAAVDLLLGAKRDAVTVPQTAVSYSLYGESVFLVEEAGPDKLQVQRQSVTTGAVRGGRVVITSGLDAGELVVIDGQVKLDNGTSVVLANEKMARAAEE